MATPENGDEGQSPEKEDAELRAFYEKYRREFTAADLQKYTEIEPGIPLEQIIAEMEEIHREETRKKDQ
jgi:hypothetical protein